MKINKEKVQSLWQDWPISTFCGSLILMLLTWMIILQPALQKSTENLNRLPNIRKELSAIRDLAGQIRLLENSITAAKKEKNSSDETLLKRMETIAQETKVFAKISRVTPTTARNDGQDTPALTIEFEKLSMAALSPFIHAISHKSLLEINALDLRRVHEEDGMMSVRITLLDS